MKCYIHAETEAVAFCRNCGKPLCTACQRLADGSVFCQEHAPAPQPAPGPSQPVASQPVMQPGAPSPGLAFVLGLLATN